MKYAKDRKMTKEGIKHFADDKTFTKYEDMPNVMNVKTHLSEDSFNTIVGNQEKANFLTYYDFLNAVGDAPRFCGSEGAGYYRELPAAAMCKKELAAFIATAISLTNEGDATKTKETTDDKGKKTEGKPYSKQGFKNNAKKECTTDASKRTEDDKKVCGKKVSDTEKSGAFTADGLCKDKCSKTKEYYPRGPGNM